MEGDNTSINVWGGVKNKLLYILYLLIAAPLPESRRMKAARWLRNYFARLICIDVHSTSNIERNAHFNPKISLGEFSSIGVSCELDGPVKIGKYVMMGPETVIYTRNHRFSLVDVPICKQGYDEYRPVTIEDDVWIGRRVIILPGVTISHGCILGAGAVVTKSTEPCGIYGGVPAKKIGSRGEDKSE